MLDDLYMKILDMTAVGSLVILAVLAARLLLRRAPKVFSYALWAVVLLRLLCPVALETSVSMVPEMTPTAQEYALNNEPISILSAGYAALEAVGDAVNGGLGVQHIHTTDVEPDGTYRTVTTDWYDVWILFGQYVWIAGFAVMLISSFVSWWELRKKLEVAVPVGEGLFLADHIQSPFVVGLLRPKIYLPANLTEKEMEYIILHERHHISRGDHIIKALAFLALAIHWFNPLVWVAFVFASRDMEMSCDEAVVRKLGPDIRADYAASLLTLATGRRIIAGSPLAFGEGDPKGRIRNLSRWKRPALWVSLITAALCIILAVCLVTDPLKNDDVVGAAYYYGTVVDRGMGVAHEGDRSGRAYVGIQGNDGAEYMFWLSEDYDDTLAVEIGDHVMVRAWQEDQLLVASRVEQTERIRDVNLDNAITGAILDFCWSEHIADAFQCANFVKLEFEREEDRITVYGIALHQAYRVEDGMLTEVSGGNVPTVLTFGINEAGEYVLAEYWEPRDGSYYTDDILAKFPPYIWPDTQGYIGVQMRACYAQAVAHFGLDTDVSIGKLLDQITPKDPVFTSLDSYSEESTYEYREMLYYGRYTLEYCFERFLQGGQTSLRGQLMAQLCQDILEELGERVPSRNLKGQAWFDAFAENAWKLAEQYDRYDLEENFPGSWALMNMLDAEGNLVDKTAPVFDTANIAAIWFLHPNAPEGLAVPAEDLPEIIAWLGTFTVGNKAASYLAPGSNTVSFRIEYADGTILENGLSTVDVGGATFYMEHALAPQCYLDLLNSIW